jgi:hypothetical protein
MGDLFSDDLEDKTYSDKMVLEDVRALVRAGQREGPLLDYKVTVQPCKSRVTEIFKNLQFRPGS